MSAPQPPPALAEQLARAGWLAAQRRAAMGQLAAAFAHEANNPLAYLSSCLEQLRQLGPDAGTEAAALLHEASDGAARLAALVRTLRPLADGDGRTAERIGVAAVLRLAVLLAGEPLRRRAPARVGGAADLHVRGHVGHLAQAMAHVLLAAAAANATAAASATATAAADPRRDAGLTVTCARRGTEVQICVRGDGDRDTPENSATLGAGGEPARPDPQGRAPQAPTAAAGEAALDWAIGAAVVAAHGGRLERLAAAACDVFLPTG